MIREVSLDRFCEEFDVPNLKETIKVQLQRYNPDGWFICICQMLDSSKLGKRWVLPYGPNNTHKIVPTMPFSIDGTASGTVCAEYFVTRESVESHV